MDEEIDIFIRMLQTKFGDEIVIVKKKDDWLDILIWDNAIENDRKFTVYVENQDDHHIE